MTSHTTTPCLPQTEIETTRQLFDNWFDPIEAGLRDRAREFLQAMLEPLGDARRHRGRNLERLMDANKVVEHGVQRDRTSMDLDLLRERIGT